MFSFIGNCAEIFHFSYDEIMCKIPYNKLMLMYVSHNDVIIRQNKAFETTEKIEKPKKFKPFKVGEGANGLPTLI